MFVFSAALSSIESTLDKILNKNLQIATTFQDRVADINNRRQNKPRNNKPIGERLLELACVEYATATGLRAESTELYDKAYDELIDIHNWTQSIVDQRDDVEAVDVP